MDVWLRVLTGLAAVVGGAWVWLLVGRGWFWRTDVQLSASSPDSASDGRPLRACARQLWIAFWASDAAQAVAWEADHHCSVPWIHCVNELLLVEGEFLAQRIVNGSMGQPRLNPLCAYIRDLLAEVERAEEVFGMNPRSRFRLGIENGAARRPAADPAGRA